MTIAMTIPPFERIVGESFGIFMAAPVFTPSRPYNPTSSAQAGSAKHTLLTPGVERSRRPSLDSGSIVGTGFYNFARAAENDTPRPSRFTMVVVKREGQWMIAHHHSSPLSATRQ
jgi:hypothetical protein